MKKIKYLHIIFTFMLFGGFFTILFISFIFNNINSPVLLYWTSVITIILCFAYVLTSKRYRMGFHFVILVYMSLCQFGFVLASYWDANAAVIASDKKYQFVEMKEYGDAVLYSALFIMAYTISVSIDRLVINNSQNVRHKKNETEKKSEEKNLDNISFMLGLILLVIGLFLLLFVFYKTKSVGYKDRMAYWDNIGWYGHLTVINSLSFPLIIANCKMKKWIFAIIPYLGIVVMNLYMGNRGEVLYTTVVCVAIYQLRKKKVDWRLLLLGACTLFIIIPFVREFRNTLDPSLLGNRFKNSIIETFSELGFQISPLTYTIEFVRKGGAGYRLGRTYLYGIVDFFCRKLPMGSGLSWNSVDNTKSILPRTGMGYSQIAEFYYNFGFWGGIVAMFCLGRFLLFLENSFDREYPSIKKAFAALLAVEIVNLTRNNSSTLMVYFTYICIIIVLLKISSQIWKNKA